MVKIGELVYCKKELQHYKFYMNVGDYCTVADIFDPCYKIIDNNSNEDIYFSQDYNAQFKFNFKDYFYTEKEIRKMKLKKLSHDNWNNTWFIHY